MNREREREENKNINNETVFFLIFFFINYFSFCAKIEIIIFLNK
jgi:hypothetical protein